MHETLVVQSCVPLADNTLVTWSPWSCKAHETCAHQVALPCTAPE